MRQDEERLIQAKFPCAGNCWILALRWVHGFTCGRETVEQELPASLVTGVQLVTGPHAARHDSQRQRDARHGQLRCGRHLVPAMARNYLTKVASRCVRDCCPTTALSPQLPFCRRPASNLRMETTT